MDSNEVCRQKAAELHGLAVLAGADPWKPYAMALREAGRRGIEVERVPQDDIRLRGSRALFDPDALLILHENSDDAFMDAFLVAHEIGHAEFGGHTEVVRTEAVDPERPVEAAPIGVDRVIDYGRRERLEVRMDLFAREFLLPRPIARRLHIDEGLSASAIAGRLDAPLAVVAQQLLDALLLPPIVLAVPAVPPVKPLNDDQRDAVRHRGVPYILEAGPGTGKTQTLVARVDILLSEGVDPSRILVLTFSNKAAGELSERIAIKQPTAVGAMWIGTFHAFGLDLIRRFHDRLGLPADPRLLDRVEAIDLLEDEFPRLNLTHFKDLWDPTTKLAEILSACSRANDEVIDAAAYRVLAETMLRSAGADEKVRTDAERSLEVAIVFAAYEAIKKRQGCVDFGDLVSLPVRLCEQDSEVGKHLSSLYQHVLVDEYQDVNRASVRLLEAVTQAGHNLWVVGDAKQSIYRFRGASSFNVARFGVTDFPGGGRGRLSINYRSTPEIIDTFLAFAKRMQVVAGGNVALKPDRASLGLTTQYRAVDKAGDEIAVVADSIEEMRAAGIPYRSQALLCSGNDRLGKFAAGLESMGIPILFLGSLFEREEIKDLISLLSILVDRRAMGLVRVATMPGLEMPLSDVSAVLTHLKGVQGKPAEWLSAVDILEGVSEPGRVALKRLAELLTGFSLEAAPWNVLVAVLLDRSRMAADISISTTVQMRSQGIAIWQFMNFIRVQPKGSGAPISRLMGRIRKLVVLSDDRDLRQLPAAAQGIDAVRLMTMHGSKGLEFPVVHIPSLNEGTLPRSPNMWRGVYPPDGLIEGAIGRGVDAVKASLAEEYECLFFVALSRARDRLLLYSPTQKSDGSRRSVSTFVDRLGSMIDRAAFKPARHVYRDPADAAINLKFTGPLSITDSQLSLYERCPRRFFYTHVLDVGGRRTETAFMQMHVAIQMVVGKIAGDPSATTPKELSTLIDAAWVEKGPVEHGYSTEFKGIARRLIDFYLESQAGHRPGPPIPSMRFPIGGAEIVIKPDQVLSRDSGGIVMRRVQTGHKRSKDGENLAAAVFRLAADAAAPGCVVELVHLGDQTVTPLKMTPKVLSNRRESLQEAIQKIQAGEFPQYESPTCPRCPSFFICGPAPQGRLEKISSGALPVTP